MAEVLGGKNKLRLLHRFKDLASEARIFYPQYTERKCEEWIQVVRVQVGLQLGL